MTKDLTQDTPPVTGDPVLLNVLATAQRFAAWYAEYLSAGVPAHGQAGHAHGGHAAADAPAGDAPSGDDAVDGSGQIEASEELLAASLRAHAERRADELMRHLQHAVFDLMAAVHEMNRRCTGEAEPCEPRRPRPVGLARAAVH